MSEDRSWSADTVAFGQVSREPGHLAPPRARPARPKLPTIALRRLALVTVAIAAVVALIVVAGGGSDSQKAPIREIAYPAPRVGVKQAPRARQREPRDAAKPHVRRADVGQRGQKASAAIQAQTAPEPAPDLPAEPAPEYVPPPAPEPAAPAAPTQPAAEFGL